MTLELPHRVKWLIGVDEAGRGPLAGPVSVAALAIKLSDKHLLEKGKVRDSKQLSELAREKIFAELKLLRARGKIMHAVSLVGNKIIDREGIVRAVKKGIRNVLARLAITEGEAEVILDGGIKAPRKFKNQETIIGGDAKVAVIAHASIVAKVTRDRKMKRFSLQFPKYNFHIHKGYGTPRHISKIKKYGLSPIHRRSFVKNFLQG